MLKFYKKITCLLITMLMSSNIVFAGMLDGRRIVLDAGHGEKIQVPFMVVIKRRILILQ
ncbi:hypothetical protein PL321_18090 [Caloramator sp. mosi_1]|uniref:hypothetical protein n=1 Tax=Caloramator sp. mosi_1 TaxID=3023090 RepID=UPI00235EA3D9|nr:hypothetical protein [Caloramator sp. mosi_1]WDC84145.1 hypothetical protein PL321_18090 [Caloramator sp. mosi_1]